jgi:hypothetical protein
MVRKRDLAQSGAMTMVQPSQKKGGASSEVLGFRQKTADGSSHQRVHARLNDHGRS